VAHSIYTIQSFFSPCKFVFDRGHHRQARDERRRDAPLVWCGWTAVGVSFPPVPPADANKSAKKHEWISMDIFHGLGWLHTPVCSLTPPLLSQLYRMRKTTLTPNTLPSFIHAAALPLLSLSLSRTLGRTLRLWATTPAFASVRLSLPCFLPSFLRFLSHTSLFRSHSLSLSLSLSRSRSFLARPPSGPCRAWPMLPCPRWT